MKSKLIKLYNFCKKHYTTSIVVISLILIVIGSLIIIKLIKINNNKIDLKESDYSVYYHFQDQKIEAKAHIKYENDHITLIESNQKNIEAEIMYINNQKHVIIPNKSAIILLDTNKNYLALETNTEIVNDNKTNIVINKGSKIASYNFFIYNGFETYFFPESVTVKINNEIYELSAYSYVTIDKNYAKVYDFDNDDIIYIDADIKKASADYKDAKIDLLNKLLVKNEQRTILDLNLENVPKYKEAA